MFQNLKISCTFNRETRNQIGYAVQISGAERSEGRGPLRPLNVGTGRLLRAPFTVCGGQWQYLYLFEYRSTAMADAPMITSAARTF